MTDATGPQPSPPDGQGAAKPPPLPPPPIVYAQPPVIRTGRGWKYLALILLVLLVISTAGDWFFWMDTGLPLDGEHHPADALKERVVLGRSDAPKVALVDLQGLIWGSYVPAGDIGPVTLLRWQLERAARDEDVRAVLLRIDSPGGEVLAADDISRAISDFQDRTGKPVVAVLGGVAASGGYYVAAPCRWIVANSLTLTGSIGVIVSSYNYRGLLDKVGVRPVVFKSGRFKNMLSGSRAPEEIPPEEARMLQALVDDAFKRFKEVIQQGRTKAARANGDSGRPLADNWEEYADGRILTGQEAYDLGFIDELGDFDTALARARQLAGIDTANVVTYEPPRRFGGFLDLLGEARTRTVRIELGSLPGPIEPGRPYFLYAPGL
ncbi:MAG: signal peptide peptidase SppA [Verrucomicrobia bacterium]|nr:MAG: signal peptide peptidase SppA [Verrucomicrobiota bacterium]